MPSDRDKIRRQDEEAAEAWFRHRNKRAVSDMPLAVWDDQNILDAFAAGRESLRAELAEKVTKRVMGDDRG